MNALSLVHFQLLQIDKFLQKDLKDGLVTYNYFFCEDECKFLDRYDLQEYLAQTQIHNFLFLKEINKKCNDIITIWNDDFKGLSDRKFKEPLIYANEETGRYFSSELDFHAIYITTDKWHSYNTRLGKENFIAHQNYSWHTVPCIAQKCAAMLNMITACYPETKDFKNVLVNKNSNNNILTYRGFTDVNFSGLRGDNVEEYYRVMYNRFLIDYSDEVYLNGALLSEQDKKLIKLSFYKIEPPGEISTSNFVNGSELNEKRFIKYELNRIETVKDISLAKIFNLEDYKQYLESLISDGKPSNKIQTEPLTAIWLPQAKISIDDFYKKGYGVGLWDKNHNITAERGSIYGTGKALLGSLSVALKGYAINSNIDYKIVGKAFCDAFKIELKEKTQNPYKLFSSTKPEYIRELKRAFGIK